MQHIKTDLAKSVCVSSVSTGGYGKFQRETLERAGGLCHRKMRVGQWEEDQPSPTRVTQRDRFSYKSEP